MRSGRMQSLTASPSLRNSGLLTTSNTSVDAAVREFRRDRVARTLSAVPTGTVDLLTTTAARCMCWPMVRATASTYLRSALPSSSGGVPTAMKTTSPCSIARGGVGREVQAAGGVVGLDHRLQAGLVDRDDAVVEAVDLRLVDVDADDVVPDFRQAGSGDEADVAGAEDGDAHAGS